MFFRRRFRRRKPNTQHTNEKYDGQKDTPFIPPVQTKLNIGKPGDIYEVEADRTADKVVNNTSDVQTVQTSSEEEELQTKALSSGLTPFVQMQSVPEEEEVQMQSVPEEEEVQMQTEEEEEVQLQEEEELQTQSEEEELQTKSVRKGRPQTNLEQKLRKHDGSGESMSPETQTEMERAFGADFSKIKIHNSADAGDMNKDLGSRAFAHGRNIYFKEGEYHPDTKEGKHLLAHELTHTIQQGAISPGSKLAGARNSTSQQMIQGDDIRYRQLTWDDFEAQRPDGDHEHDAAVASDVIEITPKGYVGYSWDSVGDQITVTVTYNRSLVNIIEYMRTEESWKSPWITDDEAARDRLGPGQDIEATRNAMLAHEQIHFLITKTVADRYVAEVKAAVPTESYTETFTATPQMDIDARAEAIASRKKDEVLANIRAVTARARAEMNKVQEIYDNDTGHGTNESHQDNWGQHFADAFEEARTRDTDD